MEAKTPKNELVNLPIADWVELRDMYLKDWPEHHTHYNALDNAIRLVTVDCKQHEDDFNIRTLNGDWRSDATFLMIVSDFVLNFMFFLKRNFLD